MPDHPESGTGSEPKLKSDGDESRQRWLLVQEFNDDGSLDPHNYVWPLKIQEVKHWWYKAGWQRSSVATYRSVDLRGLPPPDSEEEQEEKE